VGLRLCRDSGSRGRRGTRRRSGARLNPDPLVNGSAKALLAPQVPLGGLNRHVSQQELDLLQLAAGSVAQTGAGPAGVVGRDTAQPQPSRIRPDDVPHRLLRYAVSPGLSSPAEASKDFSGRDPAELAPAVNFPLDPVRHGDGADMAALAD
jgi:hypothetical protein